MIYKRAKGISSEGFKRIAESMKKAQEVPPRVYVGTYGKYNQGSIDGAWLDLQDYDTYDEFMEAATALHSDEADPELMFQGYDGIPEAFIGESWIDPKFFDLQRVVPEDEQAAFETFVDLFYPGGTENQDIEDLYMSFEDAYHGEWGTFQDYADNYIDEIGGPQALGAQAENYFDTEKFIQDMQYEGWGYVDEEEAAEDPESYPEGPGLYDPSGELYEGYNSVSELVESWLENDPEVILNESTMQNYFNYEAFARDLEYDYYFQNGYVFSSI